MTLAPLPAFVHDRTRLDGFRLYRSRTSPEPESRRVGCVVLVTVETQDEPTARAWVDAVFQALEAEPDRHPGGISAFFHIRGDGRQVINYAEWTSADAHDDALMRPPNAFGSPRELWNRVENFPGAHPTGFRRYRPR